jgi:hypothetical protein
LIHFEILGGINMKENGINQPIKPWKMEWKDNLGRKRRYSWLFWMFMEWNRKKFPQNISNYEIGEKKKTKYWEGR